MATSRTGDWSALFSTAPSSSAGLPIPGATGWRIIVQAAPVTTTHTTLTLGVYPVPTWYDVTASLISITGTTGDAADDTAPIVGSTTLTVKAATMAALTGDAFNFAVNVNERFGTQCFIRWGVYDTNGGGLGWVPQFSGIIDTVIEDWGPTRPVRTWELICFDMWYLIAGSKAVVSLGVLNDTVEPAVPEVFTDMLYMFSAEWSVGGALGAGVDGTANYRPQELLNLIAASVDCMWLPSVDGTLYLVGRAEYLDRRSTWYVLDGYSVGAGPALPTRSATVLPVAMRWVNTVDRFAYSHERTSPYASGTATSIPTTPVTPSRKFRYRTDAAGASITTINTDYAQMAAYNDLAADRADETTYCEFAEFDTNTANRNGQPTLPNMIKFLAQCSPFTSYTLQRRLSPAGYVAPLVRVDQIEQAVEMSPSSFRWTARHNYRRLTA